MNIKETFIKLTEYTYPHGREHDLKPFLPKNVQEDEFGNFFIKIGESDTMFTCHLDTCSSKYEKVNHVIGGRFIKTDGKTILGADDKAGMVILLYMIEKNVPGLYYFFIGEEVGCIGSSAASKLDFSDYNKCISFDRRGYNSVITDQFYGRCCSMKFAKALSSQLNSKNLSFKFAPDPTGVLTDSASFMPFIPECTNISVGYFSEHQTKESQDIIFLENLCNAVIKVDWSLLPIERIPCDEMSFWESESVDNKLSAELDVWINNIKWRVKLTDERIVRERSSIYQWIFYQNSYPNLKSIIWNGKDCSIEYNGVIEYLANREELMEVISEFEFIAVEDLIKLYRY